MNRWGSPAWLEVEVSERDRTYVYCGVEMVNKHPRVGSRQTVGTWEHIINDATIVTRGNIALCCAACNSSKGIKDLVVWLQSNYCKTHGITKDTVAEIVNEALNREKVLTRNAKET